MSARIGDMPRVTLDKRLRGPAAEPSAERDVELFLQMEQQAAATQQRDAVQQYIERQSTVLPVARPVLEPEMQPELEPELEAGQACAQEPIAVSELHQAVAKDSLSLIPRPALPVSPRRQRRSALPGIPRTRPQPPPLPVATTSQRNADTSWLQETMGRAADEGELGDFAAAIAGAIRREAGLAGGSSLSAAAEAGFFGCVSLQPRVGLAAICLPQSTSP